MNSVVLCVCVCVCVCVARVWRVCDVCVARARVCVCVCVCVASVCEPKEAIYSNFFKYGE
jgi:hypothetical protein